VPFQRKQIVLKHQVNGQKKLSRGRTEEPKVGNETVRGNEGEVQNTEEYGPTRHPIKDFSGFIKKGV